MRELPPLRLGEVLLRGAGVGEEQRAAPMPSPSAALGGGGDEGAGGAAAAMAAGAVEEDSMGRWRRKGRRGWWGIGFKWKGEGIDRGRK